MKILTFKTYCKMKSLFKRKGSGNELQNCTVKRDVKPLSLGSNIQKRESDEIREKENSVKKTEKNGVSAIYNLIILDESGSMSGVTSQTISGCNETLNGIRSIAKKTPDLSQYVSIFCFDTENSRYLFENSPIENLKDLTYEDYSPCGATPLYDAIGYTVSQLKKIAINTDAVGKVTIITDGYENASSRWTHRAVVELIENLKNKGWLFTFIGANIDVERTSHSLGIDSYMAFEQNDEGIKCMFDREINSHISFSKKRSFLGACGFFKDALEPKKEEILKDLNCNYFTIEERIAPDVIDTLAPDQVFVFGSNMQGEHFNSATNLAVEKFGAVMGQVEGEQGQCYAIPIDGTSIDKLREAIHRFAEYVVCHPKKNFMLSDICDDNTEYTLEQIAPLFKQVYGFGNVYVPASYLPYVDDEND